MIIRPLRVSLPDHSREERVPYDTAHHNHKVDDGDGQRRYLWYCLTIVISVSYMKRSCRGEMHLPWNGYKSWLELCEDGWEACLHR